MRGPAILLEARDIKMLRGNAQVLSVPEFMVLENEVVALIGPNGAGKSSLLLALARLLPAAGSIRYRGDEIVTARETLDYRRRLAMVFQEPLLFNGTVFDNVAAGLKIRGMDHRSIGRRVMETLELFAMAPLAERSALKLSGGEAQRTSLARAFAIGPEIIFLDEPFASLDPPTRLALLADLARILAETSTAAIVSTHDQLEALRLADRMVVMNRGEIVQGGPPVDVLNRPVDEFVAGFVGMENLLAGRVVEKGDGLLTLSIKERRVKVAGDGIVGDEAILCIRPEHITIDTCNPAGETSARNVFPAIIRKIVPAGVMEKIYLECDFPLVSYVTKQSLSDLQLREGKQLFASFKATAVHLIRSGRGGEIASERGEIKS